MRRILFGPFFNPTISRNVNQAGFAPLGLQIEWACPDSAAQNPLLVRSGNHTSTPMRLEHLLVDRKHLPFDLECPEHQVLRNSHGILPPMESILAALYGRFDVHRSILQVLMELASLLCLHHPVRRPITANGLLTSRTEAAGFRLNIILREGRNVYAKIAWQPQAGSSRFHACVCNFHLCKAGELSDGFRQPAVIPGVSPLLACKLRRLEPGAPKTMFSALGTTYLKTWRGHPGTVSR